MKILIIEDEILLADSLRAMLEGKGFSVEAVHDGETGAEYAETGVYDLLILDVMMPGMDGYQVARQVRAKRCGTPILMLTAKSSLEDRIEGLNPVHTPGVLVKNHGPFSWGKDAHEAVHNAVVMEQVAKMASIAYAVNPNLTMNPLLIEKHFSRKHGPNAYYGQK